MRDTLDKAKIKELMATIEYKDKYIEFLKCENGNDTEKFKEILKECYSINEMIIHTFNWLETIVTPSQKYICPKVVSGIEKIQKEIKEVLEVQ